jgi:predicted phosphodiesterase
MGWSRLDCAIAPGGRWGRRDMRLAVLSDIHGNLPALEAVLADAGQQGVACDETAPLRVVHGSPSSATEHLFPDRSPAALQALREAGTLAAGREAPPLDPVLAGIEEPVLICGHSHIPWQQAGAVATFS